MERKGGVPPIVTVLVTIASIVGASLVAWFLWTTTRGATSQPVFEVLSAYALATSSSSRTLSITVKYLSGPSSVSVSSNPSPSLTVTAGSSSYTCTPTAPSGSWSPGQSFTLSCSVSASSSLDGASGVLEFTVSSGGGSSRIMLGFKVVEP